MAKNKCNCNFWVGLLGLLLMAFGVYFLVWGFVTQTTSSISWNSWNFEAMLYYLVGLGILMLGKIAKCRSCSGCKIHSKH